MSKSRNILRRLWPVWLTLGLGLVMTLLATFYAQMRVQALVQREFALICEDVAEKIRARLHAHAQVLRGGAAFLSVVSNVNQAQWQAFVKHNHLDRNIPGVQGIGFSQRIAPEQLTAHIEALRAQGFPNYRVWPEGERSVYSAVIYIEPFSARNQRALGYDGLSEPIRRAAMEQAQDEDVVALSAKLLLVQETNQDVQPGALMFAPVYQTNSLDTVAQRRAALIGWVYNPYRMRDLMQGILYGDDSPPPRVQLMVYDGEQITLEQLLYNSRAETSAVATPYALRIAINFNGHRWTLDFSATPALSASLNHTKIWLIAITGTVMSLLLSILVLALRILQAREARYRLLADNITDVLWLLNMNTGRWLYISPSVERLRGYTVKEVMEQSVTEVMTPASYALIQAQITESLQRFLRGIIDPPAATEIEQTRRDGSTVWTEATTRYLWGRNGEVILLGVSRDISARKSAESALNDAECKYRDIFETSPVGLFQTSLDGRILSANSTLAHLLGFDTAEQLLAAAYDIGQQFYAQPAARIELVAQLSTQGIVQGYETQFRCQDGRCFWGTLNVSARHTANGNTLYQGAMMDIDDRKRAEQARDVALTKYQTLFNNFPLGISVSDATGTVIETNAIAEILLGISKTEHLHRTLDDTAWQLTRLDGSVLLASEFPSIRALRSGQQVPPEELGVVKPDGSTVWLSVTAAPFPLPGLGVVVIYGDITEQVEARVAQDVLSRVARLAVGAETLEAFRQALPPLLSQHLQFPIVTLEIYDAVDAEMVFAAAVGIPAANEPLRVPLEQTLAGQVVRSGEALLELNALARPEYRFGPLRALNVVTFLCAPLKIGTRVLGVLVLADTRPRSDASRRMQTLLTLANTVADALERLGTEQALREADRRKDEFLAMLAHELRNPLTPIVTAVHLLGRTGLSAAQITWCREVIDRQTAHLSRLVDDLLDVSRITRGKIELKREILDIAEIVHRAIETSQPLIDYHQHHLVTHLPLEPLQVQGDRVRLTQVLANLLNNAAKYTDAGGTLELSVSANSQEVSLRVKDSGRGIDASVLPHVFDIFFQADHTLARSEGGLGIGLSLVKRLVELHGGHVLAFSAGHGQGSEFEILLPLHIDNPIKTAAVIDVKSGGAGQLNLLVVDDNRDAADSLALLLQCAGHQVFTAYDSRTALHIAAAQPLHAALLDLGLPEMDGYTLAQALRAPAGSTLHLIAITGYGRPQDRERSKTAGFDAHLVKPIDWTALQTLLTTLSSRITDHC